MESTKLREANPPLVSPVGFTSYVSRFRLHAPAFAALLITGAIYLVVLLPSSPQALTHHDEGAKYLQVRNLRITPGGLDWSINYPARRLDPALEFVPFHPKQHYVDGQGRIYLQWPIFLGLLTRIPWKLLGFWGLYVVPFAAGLGTLWAAYLLALAVGVPVRVAWLAVPLVGLATPVGIYSLLYFEHTLAALFVTLSLLAAVRGLRDEGAPRLGILLSGALLAMAVYFRSELYVLALVMALVMAWVGWKRRRWRIAAAWVGAFAVALVPLWAFYSLSEGTLLPTHALWYFTGSEPANGGGLPQPGLPPLRYIATAGWGVVPAFLFGPENAPFAPRFAPWVEVAGLVGVGLCGVGALMKAAWRGVGWSLPVFLAGLVLVLLATGETLLSSQQYYNLHGFLLAAPFVAVALWPPGGEGAAVSSRRFLYATTLLYLGLHVLVISALSGLGPISLHEWGQRYLLPAYPALGVLALSVVSGQWPVVSGQLTGVGGRGVSRRVVPFAFCLLAAVGLGFTVRGYGALGEERAQVERWLGLTAAMPAGEPLVTDTWWLPLNLAAGFYSRPYMLAEGDARLAKWAEQMRGKGVGRFGLATTNPAVFNGAWTHEVAGLRAEGEPRESWGLWLQQYALGP
ncbi:MAG: hypothetical protein ACJ78Q_11480 [Chloroflexia bacterium]